MCRISVFQHSVGFTKTTARLGSNAEHSERRAGLPLDVFQQEYRAEFLGDEIFPCEECGELRQALAELEPIWNELFPQERVRVLALLIERVDLNAGTGDVDITFCEGAPKALSMEGKTQP